MRFHGTDTYIATDDLMVAVNAALALERPLLVKGEPGTGKTVLAEEVARALARPLITWMSFLTGASDESVGERSHFSPSPPGVHFGMMAPFGV